MSEQTTTSGGQSSEKSLTFKAAELHGLVDKYPIETIVHVSDENGKPYILLKDIDDKPYWRPYGYEKIEDVRRFHEWELNAQRKFREESRSPEELDELRNLIMSICLVTDFFELVDEKQEFIAGLLTKISAIWYCRDKKLDYNTFDPEKIDASQEKDMMAYFQLAMFYVNSFLTTMEQAVRSMKTPGAGS